jgi:hypothetical protein
MSANMQIDKTINHIIAQIFNLLKVRPIFQDCNEYCSKNSECLDVITHTNKLQELRKNTYDKQPSEAKNISPDVQKTLKKRSHYEFILSKATLRCYQSIFP